MNKLVPSIKTSYLLRLNRSLIGTCRYNSSVSSQDDASKKSSSEADELFSKSSASSDSTLDYLTNVPDAEEAIEKEENFRKYVERKRDVSRFSKHVAAIKHRNEIPVFNNPNISALKNVDPGLCWPHKQELMEIINDEKEYDLTLEQKVKMLVERKTVQLQNSENQIKETDNILKKMPMMIDGYFDRIHKKEKAEQQRLDKIKEMEDRATDYFGYKADLRDPKVAEKVKQWDMERRAKEKQAKKEKNK